MRREEKAGKRENEKTSSIFPFHALRFTFYTFLIFWLSVAVAIAETPLQIIQASTDSLLIKFEAPALQFNSQEVNGHTFARVSFTGASLTTDVGRPSLPVYPQLIGIPFDALPRVTVIDSRLEVRQTEPIIPAQPSGLANPRPTPIIDTDSYRRDRPYPTKLVEITPIGIIRGQRVARLQIQPIQYNPTRSQLKIYHELLIRINFNSTTNRPYPTSKRPIIPSFVIESSQAFEQLLQGKLLNYNQAKVWRRLPQSIPAAPAVQRTSESPNRYKILISRTGIYKITYSELRRAGAIGIELETLKMESRGRRVGLYIFDHGTDDRFDRDDSIVFYGGAPIGDRFTETNVYWLSWGGVGRSQVDVRDAAPKTSNVPTPFAFKKTVRFEQDRKYDRLLDVKSEGADHYFWESLTGGTDSRFSQKDFPVQLPHVVRGQISRDADIRIKFQGVSRERNARHQARILFNGAQLGQVAEWRQQAAPLVTRKIESWRFSKPEDMEVLRIIAEDRNGTPAGQPDFYLDWFEIDYWRTFEASEGMLAFNSEAEPRRTGSIQYRVTNLRRSDVDIYGIQDDSIIAKLVNGRVERKDGNFQLTFEDSVTSSTDYFVVERERYDQVDHIALAKPSIISNPGNQADYIIISHHDFIDAIQPLAAFRRSQGLSVMVVDVEEVYDQFNHGIFNPIAIQKFLRHTYTHWRPPKPTYVLLVGDAHYDYKGAIVKRYREALNRDYDLHPIYVPTFHGWAPASGETAMDHHFVTVSGDDPLPDMFIGRLPVQSPHELGDTVRKIVNYEAKRQPGLWQGRLMQVADNEVNNVGDDIFERASKQLVEEYIPVGYDTRKVYLRQIGSPERTNQAILRTIDEGVLIVEYSGHGGTQTWADEGIFRIADAENLGNVHPPFVITTTCLNGQFDQPLQFGQRSLSEQFLMGSAGAIAVLSATRLTYATVNAEFDKNLFTSIFTVKPSTLGAIIADAKTQFMMTAPPPWIPGVTQYTLFGDPATRLAVPELEIQVELENVVVDPSKELIIRHNSVGQHQFSPITGAVEFHKAADFSTGTMSALALFANDLDDDLTSDFRRQRNNIQVWQGEFGAIRIPIPKDVPSGQGIVRLLAFDDQRTAVGGVKFWTYQPAILEVREDIDPLINTLNLSVLIADNEGFTGLKSIEVVWSDTVESEERTVAMIPHPAPPTPAVNGGRWYKLQTAIPLPKGGQTVQYQIIVTDRTNHTIRTDKKSLKVPEGANIAIASAAIAPLCYTFAKEKKSHTLTAKLVNDGGQKIDVPIEVWFTKEDPDRDGDGQIDPGADVLGSVLIRTDAWHSGTTHLQEATATLILPKSLSTGFHRIYVFADPESPSDDHEDGVIGKLDEPRSFDNKGSGSFVVNEFTLKANEDLTAFSLDRVFSVGFPIGAVSESTITLSVNAIDPLISFQPDLRFVSLPRLPTLQSGYQVELYSDSEQLVKPAALKFRYDLEALKAYLQTNRGSNPETAEFKPALQRESENLAIYQWQAGTNAWKRLPSEILRDNTGNLVSEKFVTSTQAENRSVHNLRTSYIHVTPNLTPAGRWAILLLDADRYRVLFQRKGTRKIEEIDQTGRIGQPLRDAGLGIELEIPRLGETDGLGRNLAFEFGDVLTFETDFSPNGEVHLTGLRSTNRGEGSAHVNIRTKNQIASKGDQSEVSNWLIFFRDSEHFELRNARNELALHTTGNPAVGTVNQLLVLDNFGIEVLVTSSIDLGFEGTDNPSFEFGDKFKFSKTTVGIISTKARELSTFTLMKSSDREPPKIQLWVDGETPSPSSIIPPRPQIFLLLTDKNGVDLDSFSLGVSKDGGTFEVVKDLEISGAQVTSVSIRYKPTLFIGSYRFRIKASDLTGNTLGGEYEFREFTFSVAEPPDLEPPTVEIRVNDEILTADTVIREQPKFEILIADEGEISPTTIQFAFGPTTSPLFPLPEDHYELEFDVTQPTQARITFEPDLPNDEYQLQVLATDVSENRVESQIYRFHLEEPVSVTHLLNAPNPIRTNTVFTYNLAQAPDQVAVKIYTVSGRLIRTIDDASARRGYNETDWDARDENGEHLANGVYFYKVIVKTGAHKIEKIGRLAILR